MLPTVEGLLLRHGDIPYDPIQAHAYYLRTRELKGRTTGTPQAPIALTKKDSTSTAVKPVKKVVVPITLVSKQRQEAVNIRVSAIQERLSKLNGVLSDLIAELEAKGGKEDKTDKTKSEASSKAGSDKKTELTPTQKREAAVKAKELYDKTKKDVPKVKSKEELQKEITKVREQIKKIRVELKDAVEKARQHVSKSKTVQGR